MITSGVHAFCKLGDVLYVGTEKGLYVYKGGVFEHVLVDKNVFSRANFVTGMGGRRKRYIVALYDGRLEISSFVRPDYYFFFR